ncbi:MAG: hypothetical protein AAF609_05600 [Cyanobacteria bacterium P01_C01_bin.120]
MAVPVFVYRPSLDVRVRQRLESLVKAEAGDVVMESETPVDGRIMVMVSFEDELTADAFVAQAEALSGVIAEKETSMRVAGKVLYG